MKQRVYISGPYTKGDVAVNVRNAIKAADKLANLGYVPFVPQLTHFWHLVCPRPYSDWLEIDLEFLPLCDVVLRLPGDSAGAEIEVKTAEKLGIPVLSSVDAVHRRMQYLKAGI